MQAGFHGSFKLQAELQNLRVDAVAWRKSITFSAETVHTGTLGEERAPLELAAKFTH
jgi:hypothetical protein